MSAWHGYDEGYDPPAPVVPVRITDPGGDAAVVAPGLIDTGADCTLIPEPMARGLRLPLVGRVVVRGVGGGGGEANVYAGQLELGGAAILGRLVAYENEVIVGRDLLERRVCTLDGPRRRVRVAAQLDA